MKFTKNLFTVLIVFILATFLNDCGGNSSSPTNSNQPVNVGTAPNGSAVIISQGSFPISQSGSASGTVSIVGGQPNTSVTITFNINEAPTKKHVSGKAGLVNSQFADNGITITTAPSPCVVGTFGTNLPTICPINITVSSATAPGTYIVTPMAVDNTGASVNLSQITIVVSGNVVPSTPSVAITTSLTAPYNIMAGQTFTITATSVNNATDTVNFANSSDTPTITYSPASCQVTSGSSCTTTVTVGSTTPSASDTTNITTTGGTTVTPSSITFAVTGAAPLITISGAPNESIVAGQSFVIIATSVNSATGTVSFADSASTSGIIYTPSSCDVQAGDSCSVIESVALGTSTGNYTTNITTSGSDPVSPESIVYSIVTPQLEITQQPLSIITYGGIPESTMVIFSIDSSQIPANISSIALNIVSNNPAAATVSASTCTIVISNGVVTSPCTLTVTAVAPGSGTTTIEATATNYTGVTSNTITVTNVPSIAITSSLINNSIVAGQTFTITATSVNNAAATVNFANQITESTITYSPASCAVAAGESCTVTATVGLETPAAAGYTTSITDSDSIAISPSSLSFSVTQPTLTVTTQPNPSTIVVGGSPSTTTVAFSISPVPEDGTTSIPLNISSSNPASASVTSSCNITISAGITIPCNVTVTAIAESSIPVTITAIKTNASSATSDSITVFGGFSFPYGILLNKSESIAYVTSAGNNTVFKCVVNDITGTLSGCINSGGTGFSQPTGITLNKSGTIAYITNYNNSIVSQCAVNGTTGTLSGCINSGGTGFSQPAGITLNKSESIAYVTNAGNNIVSKCAINNVTGSLSSCVNSGVSSFQSPRSITLNESGTIAYITNFTGTTVSKCTVNNITGSLSSCVNSGGSGFLQPSDMALNESGTIAYVTNAGNNIVSKCAINNVTGSLSSCVNSGGSGFSSMRGIILNSTGTIAYVTNHGNNTTSQCAVNATTGALSGCSTFP